MKWIRLRDNSLGFRKLFMLLFCLILHSQHSFSQLSDIHFEHITDVQGASLGEVNAIAYDSLGFLWIGGKALFRYDGAQAHQIDLQERGKKHKASRYLKLINTDDGRIWALEEQKIILINPYYHQLDSTIELDIGINFFDMELSSHGDMWLTVDARQLSAHHYQAFLYQIKDGKSRLIDTLQHEQRFSPEISQFRDTLYVAMRDHIARYTPSGERLPSLAQADSIKEFHRFSFDSAGNIWIKEVTEIVGDQEHVLRLDRQTGRAYSLEVPDNIRNQYDLRIAQHGDILWIAGINGDLYQLDMLSNTWYDQGDEIRNLDGFPFPNSNVRSFQAGEQNVKWLCTTHGLIKITQTNWPIQTYLTGLYDFCTGNYCSMRGIAEDDSGHVYMSYYDNVHKFEKGGPYGYPLLPTDRASRGSYSLSYQDGALYWNMLKINPLDSKMVQLLPQLEEEHVTNCVDEQGNIWFYTWRPAGLYCYFPKEDFLQAFPLPAELNSSLQNINYMLWDSVVESLWICGAKSGFCQISLKGELLKQYDARESHGAVLPSNNAKVAWRENEQKIWIGHGKGLSVLDVEKDTTTSFRIHPTTDYEVVGILPQGDTILWVSTNRGIYQFDKATRSFIGFPAGSTIAGTEFNRASFFQGKGGDMYFGSMSGVFRFSPERIQHFMRQYDSKKIALTSFSRFNTGQERFIRQQTGLHELKKIILSHEDRLLELTFSLPDFRAENSVFYSYKLAGRDAKWSEWSTSNQLNYSDLPPGKYQLNIRAKGAEAIVQRSELQLDIFVKRPWWKRWWAIVIYILSGAVLLWRIGRYELRRRLAASETRRLRELDELKTNLYTNITHEFRTPLTVILGMADQLQKHPYEQKLIRRQGNHLLDLINQMLDLAKLEAGLMQETFTTLELATFLRYLIESFESAVKEKDIELSLHSKIEAGQVKIDEKGLQHIINNLVSNAIKFTPLGGKITVYAQQSHQQGNWLKIQITDTGIGISQEEVEHIFNRFHQAQNQLVGAGTGIGLALVKELVDLMGGEISVLSEEGEGTTFTVQLPFDEAIASDQVESPILLVPKRAKITQASPQITKPIRSEELPQLLVVEDNQDVAQYVIRLLQDSYQIHHAPNGQAGIEYALEHIPDIIISDVMMPKKSGFDLCKTLKQDERSCHIPIILLTAKAAQQDKLEGLSYGADAYLMKPFDKDELLIRLERLLSLRKRLQEKYSLHEFMAPAPTKAPKAPSLDEQFLQKIREIVEARLDDSELNIAEICEAMHLSKMQLYRKLKALTQQTPTLFVRSIRLHHAYQLLQKGELNVSEVAYSVGFSDPSYFGRAFKEVYKKTPKEVLGEGFSRKKM